MLDLPRKDEERIVDVGWGVKFRLETFTDREMIELMDKGGLVDLEGGEVAFKIPRGDLVELFGRKVRGQEGEVLTIEGEPFDPTDEEHLRAVRPEMKDRAMMDLFLYQIELPEDVRGNSTAPAGPSPEGSTPSADSDGANDDSS